MILIFLLPALLQAFCLKYLKLVGICCSSTDDNQGWPCYSGWFFLWGSVRPDVPWKLCLCAEKECGISAATQRSSYNNLKLYMKWRHKFLCQFRHGMAHVCVEVLQVFFATHCISSHVKPVNEELHCMYMIISMHARAVMKELSLNDTVFRQLWLVIVA